MRRRRRRRAQRAWLQRPWAAGPGRTTHRHPDRLEAAARPAGPGRTTSRRAERSSQRGRLAGGAGHAAAGDLSGQQTASRKTAAHGAARLAGQHTRRPQHPWRHRQQNRPAKRSATGHMKPVPPLQIAIIRNLKPPTPLLASEQRPLKPTTPLQPKNARKIPTSRPQRR